MKTRISFLALLPILASTMLIGACDDTQTVVPKAQGERGETCLARNDCIKGLACISGVCSKNDFEIAASAKQCDVVQCTTQADCCGDSPAEAPAKCANRTSTCETPSFNDCDRFAECTDSSECGSGTCVGQCGLTGFACTSDEECTLSEDTCQFKSCDCTNPDYDPSDPICYDEECTDVCTLTCEDERCVPDTSCESDDDCLFSGRGKYCEGGSCVECKTEDDCDTDEGESCVGGFCEAGCKANEECRLFHACEQGECVEKGCTSDRECMLAANSISSSSDDVRLAKCLPSDTGDGLNTCKVPCDNDAVCNQAQNNLDLDVSEFQVCEAGFCKFVGCETDDECRAYLRISNEERNSAKPYVSKAVCRE